MSKRILSVELKREVDTDPDFSCLGEYTDQADDWAIERSTGEYVIDLKKMAEANDDDWEPPSRGRDYRFFMPYAGGEDKGTDDYRKYGLQDFKRCEDYNRQEWCYVGIWASADVIVEGDTRQTIRSGGLWGIETDSDDSYFEEVNEEQLDELHDQLVAIGFTSEEIHEAFDKVKETA